MRWEKRRPTRWPGIYSYETQRKGRLYGVRFRDQHGRSSEKRGFRTQRDARAFQDTVATQVRTSDYVTARAGMVTLDELDAELRTAMSMAWAATYKATRSSAWRAQIRGELGHMQVRHVDRAVLQAWINRKAEDGLSSKYCVGLLQHVSGVLAYAVDQGRIRKNSAESVSLPRRAPNKRRRYLSQKEVKRIAGELDSFHRAVFCTLVYTGIRWGELAALEVGSVDLERGRASIRQGATRVHMKGGGWQLSTPKNKRGRTVPLPRQIKTLVATRLSGRRPTDLVFPPRGRTEFLSLPQKPLPGRKVSERTNWLWAACMRAEIEPVTPHDLRHTFASLAVQAGASVKVVQNALGHASAAMTLDIYADLFDHDLDSVADRLYEGWEDDDDE